MGNWRLIEGSKSSNEIDYKVGATVTGICMGSSALWCASAKKGNFTVKPIDPANQERAKELTKYFVEDTNENDALLDRLQALLDKARVIGIKIPLTGSSSGPLIDYVEKTPGIYLICVGTHVMAISSLAKFRYFYDIENGLYAHDDKGALISVIKKLRDDEWGLTGKWGWYGLRCVGVKCL